MAAPFAGGQGKIWKGTYRDWREAHAKTVKGAGVPWKHNALRHSFISYRLADIHDENKWHLRRAIRRAPSSLTTESSVKPDAAKTWFSLVP